MDGYGSSPGCDRKCWCRPKRRFLLAADVGMVKFERSALGDVDTRWELIKLEGDLIPVHEIGLAVL